MSSQLGTALLALLSVLKHGVTPGRRVKHKCSVLSTSNNPTGLLQDKALMPELPAQFSFSHWWHNQGASQKGRGVAPTGCVSHQQFIVQ